MKKDITVLHESEIALLTHFCEVLTFNEDFDLVYEHQIPHIGIALLAGEIALIRKKIPTDKLASGHLLGLGHLLNSQPLKQGLRVRKNSKLVVLSKTMIEETLNNPGSQLYPLVHKLANA